MRVPQRAEAPGDLKTASFPLADARLPLVVIDGKPFTWEQVGHMLMTFEGFTLEARVKDTIEVLGDRD